jgi:hypothetical protein
MSRASHDLALDLDIEIRGSDSLDKITPASSWICHGQSKPQRLAGKKPLWTW